MQPRRSFLVRAGTTPTLYLIVGVLLLGALLAQWVHSLGGVEKFREHFGFAAPFVTVPIHVVVALTPVPSDPISIANGALYGFASGVCLSWLGWWIAALVEFGLGHRARRDFQLDESIERLPGWLRRFPIDHPCFLIGGRLIPWIGGHVTSFLPGVAGVRVRRYAWCSAIAVVPGAVVMSAIGAGLMRF